MGTFNFMDKLPIALVIFSATPKKLGRNDYFRIAINNLASLIDLDKFPFKLLSVKYPIGDEEEAQKYKTWAENRGFEVLLNEGNWVNGEISKTKEYILDYIKVYHNDKLNQFPFVFEMEDDVTLEVKEGKLEDYLVKSVEKLIENKGLLACRFTDRIDEFDRINRLNAKYGLNNKKAIKIEGENNYFLDSDHCSFRNYIARTRDFYQMSRILLHNFDKLHPSAETSVTQALMALSDFETPFLCWETSLISHKHMFIPE